MIQEIAIVATRKTDLGVDIISETVLPVRCIRHGLLYSVETRVVDVIRW